MRVKDLELRSQLQIRTCESAPKGSAWVHRMGQRWVSGGRFIWQECESRKGETTGSVSTPKVRIKAPCDLRSSTVIDTHRRYIYIHTQRHIYVMYNSDGQLTHFTAFFIKAFRSICACVDQTSLSDWSEFWKVSAQWGTSRDRVMVSDSVCKRAVSSILSVSCCWAFQRQTALVTASLVSLPVDSFRKSLLSTCCVLLPLKNHQFETLVCFKDQFLNIIKVQEHKLYH